MCSDKILWLAMPFSPWHWKGNKYNIIKSKTTLNDKMHIYTVLFFKAVLWSVQKTSPIPPPLNSFLSQEKEEEKIDYKNKSIFLMFQTKMC